MPDNTSTIAGPAPQVPRFPGALPLLGHALRFRRDPLAFLLEQQSMGDVVEIRLGPERVYMVNEPNLIHHVFIEQSRAFERGPQADKLRAFFGDGLLSSGGSHYRRQRRLVQQAFHQTQLTRYAKIMQDITARRVESWQPDQVVHLDREMSELTLEVVASALFSADLGTDTVREIRRLLPVLLEGMKKRVLAPLGWWEHLPTPGNRLIDSSTRQLHSIIDGIIAEYRARPDTHDDLLSILLTARDEETGERMSDEQVRDEVLTLMAAGHETTAHLLAWSCHLLGQAPVAEASLHQEVDTVLSGRPPEISEIPALVQTRRILMETLRMYPPGWLLSSRATETTSLGEYRIPAGSTIFISPYSLHRNPKYFPRAAEFDPDRWHDGDQERKERMSFTPFASGIRRCVGESFAMLESTIVLATVAQHWKLVPIPAETISPVPSATLHPKQLPMLARRRTT